MTGVREFAVAQRKKHVAPQMFENIAPPPRNRPVFFSGITTPLPWLRKFFL
jgi:hypothetical protein